MKYTLKTTEDMMSVAESLGIGVGTSMLNLIRAILSNAKEAGEKSCRINIDPRLLSASYASVPAMLAKTVGIQIYPSVQAQWTKDMITILAANSKQPTTFKAKALASLRKTGRFVRLRGRIPKSYLDRPETFASILARESGSDIAIIAKSSKIIWKTA